MKPHLQTTSICISILALSKALVSADPIVDMTPFDLNKNQVYEASEKRAAKLAEISTLFAAADVDFNGKLSDKEKADYLAKAVVAAEEKVKGYEPQISDPTPMTQEQLVNSRLFQRATPNEDYWPLLGVQIRRTLADVDTKRADTRTDRAGYAADLQEVNAAEFGFASNQISGDESWFARGVIARPFQLSNDAGGGGFITPSVQFDRVKHSADKKAEIDSLIFGVTGSWITNAFGPVLESELRGGAEFGTDFDFGREIFGGALEWEPTFKSKLLANGNTQNLFGMPHVLYRTRQYLHFEGGIANDLGPGVSQDDYARAGAGVGLATFFTGALDRLALTADYRYYWDMLGGADDFDSFKTSLQWQLDEVGHLTLQVTYEQGLIRLSHQEVDLISVGLGIKF
jgi:hypothetical protein